MIKFLPVLQGIAIVHIYSQKKLSRQVEQSDIATPKVYTEVNLLYGSDMKNNT